jgi:hypothetical protein
MAPIYLLKSVSWGYLRQKKMPKGNKSSSWIDLLKQLAEVYFKSSRKSTQGRTWHQHVVPCESGWAVRREGNKRVTSKHRLQETAINKAKRLARKYKADVIIHREDGTIRDRLNYD